MMNACVADILSEASSLFIVTNCVSMTAFILSSHSPASAMERANVASATSCMPANVPTCSALTDVQRCNSPSRV